MANNFYDNSDEGSRFIDGELARGPDVDAKFDAVEAGFDLVEARVVVAENASAADAAAAAASAAAALVSENAAAASEASAADDAAATAADRVQTGLDATATAADRVQTGLDAVATGDDAAATAADRVQTGLDVVATGDDAAATAADRVQTGLDAASAAADAAAAAASLDTFDDIFLGAKASDPTLDNDGDALQAGALYFNTSTLLMRVYTGAAWVGLTTGTTMKQESFTAVADQTTFSVTGGYDVGFIVVFLNGVALDVGVDVTADDGSDVILAEAAAADDIVTIVAFSSLSIANTVQKSGDTMAGTLNFTSGNIQLSGAGQFIEGDFSSALVADRTLFRDKTLNGNSLLGVVPNGTGTVTGLMAFADEDPDNTSWGGITLVDTVAVRLNSDKTGTGSYLPIQVNAGGAVRMTFDTSGRVGVGVTPSVARFEVLGTDKSSVADYSTELSTSSTVTNAGRVLISQRSTYGVALAVNSSSGTSAFMDLQWVQRSDGSLQSTVMRYNFNGTVEFKEGKFGYGQGAGGTVTQLTSKSTAVTLNKASGRIVMNAASLAANTTVLFTLNNSLIEDGGDTLIVTLNASGIASTADYNVWCAMGSGSAVIALKNISGGALAEAVTLRFNLIKGSIS